MIHLITGITEKIRRLQQRTGRTVLCKAPYAIEVYRDLLDQLYAREDVRFCQYRQIQGLSPRHSNFFVRHDVDTRQCIENLSMITDADRDRKIHSGIYFRVDGQEYRLKHHRDLVLACRDSGFEVGLHTVCYAQDDYLAEFERETEIFTDEAGFRPDSFSVHGQGSFRLDVRNRFYKDIARNLGKYGYRFGDIPQIRDYDHVIHDCHSDEQGDRFICDDFSAPRLALRKGRNYLILTHPCYWQQ